MQGAVGQAARHVRQRVRHVIGRRDEVQDASSCPVVDCLLTGSEGADALGGDQPRRQVPVQRCQGIQQLSSQCGAGLVCGKGMRHAEDLKHANLGVDAIRCVHLQGVGPRCSRGYWRDHLEFVSGRCSGCEDVTDDAVNFIVGD